MRNLQYKMRICRKSHDKVTKTVYVWFEFLWIRRYVDEAETYKTLVTFHCTRGITLYASITRFVLGMLTIK